MKKMLLTVLTVIMVFSLVSCGNKAETKDDTKDDTIQITEKMYLTWINEIYTNPDKYMGKTVDIEGMFAAEAFDGKTFNYVYRVGPGCCGNDGSMCGFEFTTDQPLPKENDWISVKGTLDRYQENGVDYLTLSGCTFEVLEERGKKTITQ